MDFPPTLFGLLSNHFSRNMGEMKTGISLKTMPIAFWLMLFSRMKRSRNLHLEKIWLRLLRSEDGADTAILSTRRGRYARPLDPPPSPVGSQIIGSGNRNEQLNPAKVLKTAPVKSAHKKTIQSESPSMNGWLIEDADVNDIKPMKRSHLKRKHPGC